MDSHRPVGAVLDGWTPPPAPGPSAIAGRYARLERLSAKAHAEALFAANSTDARIWDYLPYGPFETVEAYSAWVATMAPGTDPMFYAIRDQDSGHWGGVASYLRIAPGVGSIELGHINLSPRLQGTRAATEALTLMIRWAMEAGYRRFEWKCDALNAGSRRAAERLGLSYEGTFRQATIVKGRNRDTAWFAATDGDWPALRTAYDSWLAPENFTSGGQQRQSLTALTAPVLVAQDPARKARERG